jgi:hypothetical protein
MSELLKLIQEADVASLEMERAKAAVEASKMALENAKETLETARKAFDEVLTKADDLGVPRQKVRKLIEERTYGLVTSGLMIEDAPQSSQRANVVKLPKAAKMPKKAKALEAETADDFASFEEEAPSMSLS